MSKGCSVCGEWPVVIVQRCHPEEPTMALLHKGGQVTIVCAKCEKIVISFQTKIPNLEEDEDEKLH